MVCYEMAKHPEVQEKLVAELKTSIDQDSSTPYTPEKLEAFEACSYLDAVCKEGLRLHPSVITILERIVPSTGMVLGGRFYVPPGTIVAMQACSRHKDPEVFPDPLAFRPERYAN
jgi:cytochrome P450